MDSRRFRLQNIIDDYSRESLAIEIDTSLPALRVIRTLEQLIERRTKPARIRVDDGSLRKELLDVYLFYSLRKVRQMAEERQHDYNYERPHESLGNVPPVEFINPTLFEY